jgi:hypothetical protein
MSSGGGLIIRVTGVESTVNSTPNTVGDSSFVRVLNSSAGTALVTQQNVAANTANVSISLAAGKETFLNKAPVDTLTSNVASGVLAVGIKRF